MKRGFWYRFFVIFLAYALAGGLTLSAVAGNSSTPRWLLWTLFGCFLGAFALTVGINEFIIYRKKKNKA